MAKTAKKFIKVKKRMAPLAPAPEILAQGTPTLDTSAAVMNRLYAVVQSRRLADPAVSHSARMLSRGTAKIAQKFGEEAVEALIEAVAKNRPALISESADVLYHLLLMWVDAEIEPAEIWAELERREGRSGIAEKTSRAQTLLAQRGPATSKIP